MPSLRHRPRVVIRILNHLCPMSAQEILLPLLRVGRHVDTHMKPDRRTHDADGHAKIARRADLHGIARKEVTQIGDFRIVIIMRQQTRIHRQPLRMLQHLIDPAARLHRTRNREMAVHLQQKTPRDLCPVSIGKPFLHRRDGTERRLDETIRLLRFRKGTADKGRKPTKPRRRIRNIVIRDDELRQSVHHIKGQETRIDPYRLLCAADSSKSMIPCDKNICIHIILL